MPTISLADIESFYKQNYERKGIVLTWGRDEKLKQICETYLNDEKNFISNDQKEKASFYLGVAFTGLNKKAEALEQFRKINNTYINLEEETSLIKNLPALVKGKILCWYAYSRLSQQNKERMEALTEAVNLGYKEKEGLIVLADESFNFIEIKNGNSQAKKYYEEALKLGVRDKNILVDIYVKLGILSVNNKEASKYLLKAEELVKQGSILVSRLSFFLYYLLNKVDPNAKKTSRSKELLEKASSYIEPFTEFNEITSFLYSELITNQKTNNILEKYGAICCFYYVAQRHKRRPLVSSVPALIKYYDLSVKKGEFYKITEAVEILKEQLSEHGDYLDVMHYMDFSHITARARSLNVNEQFRFYLSLLLCRMSLYKDDYYRVRFDYSLMELSLTYWELKLDESLIDKLTYPIWRYKRPLECYRIILNAYKALGELQKSNFYSLLYQIKNNELNSLSILTALSSYYETDASTEKWYRFSDALDILKKQVETLGNCEELCQKLNLTISIKKFANLKEEFKFYLAAGFFFVGLKSNTLKEITQALTYWDIKLEDIQLEKAYGAESFNCIFNYYTSLGKKRDALFYRIKQHHASNNLIELIAASKHYHQSSIQEKICHELGEVIKLLKEKIIAHPLWEELKFSSSLPDLKDKIEEFKFYLAAGFCILGYDKSDNASIIESFNYWHCEAAYTFLETKVPLDEAAIIYEKLGKSEAANFYKQLSRKEENFLYDILHIFSQYYDHISKTGRFFKLPEALALLKEKVVEFCRNKNLPFPQIKNNLTQEEEFKFYLSYGFYCYGVKNSQAVYIKKSFKYWEIPEARWYLVTELQKNSWIAQMREGLIYIDYYPEDIKAYKYLASICFKRNDFYFATKFFKQGLKLAKHQEEKLKIYRKLVKIFQETHQVKEAARIHKIVGPTLIPSDQPSTKPLRSNSRHIQSIGGRFKVNTEFQQTSQKNKNFVGNFINFIKLPIEGPVANIYRDAFNWQVYIFNNHATHKNSLPSLGDILFIDFTAGLNPRELIFTSIERIKDDIKIYLRKSQTSEYSIKIIEKHAAAYHQFCLGIQSFLNKEYIESIKYFSKSLEQEEEFSFARYALAVALIKTNEFNKAIDYLRKVLETDEEFRDVEYVHYYLGLAYATQKDTYTAASRHFQKAVEESLFFEDKQFLENEKISYEKKFALENPSMETCNNLIAKFPDDLILYYHRGILFYKQSQFLKAIEDFTKTLDKSSVKEHQNEIFYLLGNSYFQLKKYKEVIIYYKRFMNANDNKKIKTTQTLAQIYGRMGVAEFKQAFSDNKNENVDQKKVYEILNLFKIFLEYDENFDELYEVCFYQGRCLLMQYAFSPFHTILKNAASSFEQAIQLRFNPAEAQYYFGLAQLMLGQYEHSLDAINTAERLGYKAAFAHKIKGEAHFKLNNFSDAMTAFNAYINSKEKKELGYVYFMRAQCYEKHNHLKQKTYEDLLAAIQENYKNSEVYFYAGKLANELKKYNEAEKHFILAMINANPANDAELYFELGIAYQGLNKHIDAIKAFNDALKAGNKDNFIYQKLGISYFLTHKPQNALQNFSFDRTSPAHPYKIITFYRANQYQDVINNASINREVDVWCSYFLGDISVVQKYFETNASLSGLSVLGLASKVQMSIANNNIKDIAQIIKLCKEARENKANAETPELIELTLSLLELYLENGYWGDALELIKLLSKSHIPLYQAHWANMMIRYTALKGDDDRIKARANLEDIPTDAFYYEKSQYWYAKLKLALNEPTPALAAVNALIEKSPNYAMAYWLRAQIHEHENLNNLDEASADYEKFKAYFPQTQHKLKKANSNSRASTPSSIRLQNLSTHDPHVFSLGDLSESLILSSHTVEIDHTTILGRGSYATVYKGKYHGSEVAIKVLSSHIVSSVQTQLFKEVDTLASLRFKHIIHLFGAYKVENEYMIVMEYMNAGSLYTLIHEQKKSLSLEVKADMLKQVAQGMEYLHKNNVIHRDIKSLNILINVQYVVKISDFGLSLTLTDNNEVSRELGTILWMAPELFSTSLFNIPPAQPRPSQDVYSFGIVCWEIVAEQLPYENLKRENSYATRLAIQTHVQQGNRPIIPRVSSNTTVPSELKNLIENCWAQDPKERPTAKDIVKSMEKFSIFSSSDSKAEETLVVPESLRSNTASLTSANSGAQNSSMWRRASVSSAIRSQARASSLSASNNVVPENDLHSNTFS